MGNTLSSTPTPDKLKDQIFSIVLYYVAPKANPNLKFALRDNCTENNLPIPEQADYESLLDFYNTNDTQVYRYLQNHILNSQENTTRFYQTLINKLAPPKSKKLMNDMIEAKILQSREASVAGEEPVERPTRLTRSQLDQISEFESGQSLVESDYGLFGGGGSPQQPQKSQTSRKSQPTTTRKSTTASRKSERSPPLNEQRQRSKPASERSHQVSERSQRSQQVSERSQRSQQVSEKSQPVSERSKQVSEKSQAVSERSKQVSEKSQPVSARSELSQKASQRSASPEPIDKEEISSGFHETEPDLRSPGYSEDEFTIPNESELERYLGKYNDYDDNSQRSERSERSETEEASEKSSQRSEPKPELESEPEPEVDEEEEPEPEIEEEEPEVELEPSTKSQTSSVRSSRRGRNRVDESTLSVASEYRSRNRFGKKCMIKD